MCTFAILAIFLYICIQLKYIIAMSDLNQIKVVLVKKKKTGKWLAEQLGKSTCTVSSWCSNKSQPDLQTLCNIAKLLDVEPGELLNGKN